MLVTRGLGGLVPGLVTAGLEGVTMVIIVSVSVDPGGRVKRTGPDRQKQILTLNREDEEIEAIIRKIVECLT